MSRLHLLKGSNVYPYWGIYRQGLLSQHAILCKFPLKNSIFNFLELFLCVWIFCLHAQGCLLDHLEPELESLWAIMWHLGIKSRPSERAPISHDHWAFSLQPRLLRKEFFSSDLSPLPRKSMCTYVTKEKHKSWPPVNFDGLQGASLWER